MPSGIIKDPNRSLGGHFSKSSFTLQQVRMDNYVFYHFSLIGLIMPHPNPIGIMHEVLALALEGMWKEVLLIACVWLVLRSMHPPEACCHRNFIARQVHRGSSENHTSSTPRFVENGPTGSLHNCSGLHDKDKEFVWNERQLENQQPVLVPWLLWL